MKKEDASTPTYGSTVPPCDKENDPNWGVGWGHKSLYSLKAKSCSRKAEISVRF